VYFVGLLQGFVFVLRDEAANFPGLFLIAPQLFGLNQKGMYLTLEVLSVDLELFGFEASVEEFDGVGRGLRNTHGKQYS
jgi:hypothetical protein